MFCAQCGKPVGDGAKFCNACGAKVALAEEAVAAGARNQSPPQADPGEHEETGGPVLLRFGPMGIGVSQKRPALFTKTYQNCTEISANAYQLWGVRKMPRVVYARHGKESGNTVFQIPYHRIVSATRADYLANKALWIVYRQGQEEKGVGIEASVFKHQAILDLENLLKERMAALPKG